jgi:selenocysteine lyase/cysteine desulfurase
MKKDEADASPSLTGLQEGGPSSPAPSASHALPAVAQQAPAFLGAKEDDATHNLDMPHGDHPLDVADKVAHYLQSVTTANGGPGGGVSVDTIDDLLDRVKSAYLRLVGSTVPENVRSISSSTDCLHLLVPLAPDDREVRTSSDGGDEGPRCDSLVPHRRVATLTRGSSRRSLPP